MRATLSACLVIALATIGCGGKSDDTGDDDDTPDACRGIGCQIVDCGAMGLPPTSITGIVFAPNGTLPLNGVNVYVPVDPLPPFTEGVTCDRCTTTLPGSPVAQTVSDATGAFRLDNVPAGANIPLVVTTGKWRREVVIPTINQCTENQVGMAETRLPKNKAEGNIPKIALTTGGADSLECLIRKLGVEDSEITTDTGDGRIHYFAGNGGVSMITGSGAMANATTLWDNPTNLAKYDIVFFSCEGAQNQGQKSQAALTNVEQYTAIGGRVFASHWHNIWVGGAFEQGGAQEVTAWAGTNNSIASGGVADWSAADGDPGDPITIDEVSNPKGTLFADWMVNVGGASAGRGKIDMVDNTRRRTAIALDTSKAEMWVKSNANNPQMFQFTTPITVTSDQRCGKVVYTDMHVSGNPGGNPFPNDGGNGGACGNNVVLSEQEKALAFMFFDIAGCVGGLF
jgi:hypothetical protein